MFFGAMMSHGHVNVAFPKGSEQVADGHSVEFQKDGAPAHTSKKTRHGWSGKSGWNFWAKKTWLPSCPDLNSCDYFVQGVLEGKACMTCHMSG